MLLDKAASYHLTALRGANRSANTLRSYTLTHTQFIAYAARSSDGPPTLEALNIGTVRAFLAETAARCSPATVHLHAAILRAWCNLLVTDLGVFPDGTPLAGLKPPRVPRKLPATLDRRQFDVLVALSTQARHPLRNTAILKLLVESGLRNQELCALLLADVQLATKEAAGRVLVRAGKGRKQRYVGFGQDASKALAAYLTRERGNPTETPWLFLAGDRPLLPGTVRSLFRELRERAGMSEELHVHSLRHTFATWRAKAGMNAFALQAQMGHADIQQTNGYVTLAARDVQDSYISILDGPTSRARPAGRHCAGCGCHTAAGRVS